MLQLREKRIKKLKIKIKKNMLQPREGVLEGLSTAAWIQHSGRKLPCPNQVCFVLLYFCTFLLFCFCKTKKTFWSKTPPSQPGGCFVLFYFSSCSAFAKKTFWSKTTSSQPCFVLLHKTLWSKTLPFNKR